MVDDIGGVDHRRSVADAYALQPPIRAPSTAALQTNKLHDSACCRPIATWWACSLLTGMHLAAALAFAVAWTPYGSGNTGWSPAPVTRFVHQAFVGSGGRKEPHSAVGRTLLGAGGKGGLAVGQDVAAQHSCREAHLWRRCTQDSTAAQGLLQRKEHTDLIPGEGFSPV